LSKRSSAVSRTILQCAECSAQFTVGRNTKATGAVNLCPECRKKNGASLKGDTTSFNLDDTKILPKYGTEKKKPSTAKPVDILEGLDHLFPKRQMSKRYFLTNLIVAMLMLVFPACYAALVGLAAYSVVHFVLAIENFTTYYWALGLVLYTCPILVSTGFLILLLKPLWARPAKKAKQRVLKPSDAPMLFKFVNRIACTVGAPLPKAIHVSLEPNASAHIHGQIRGIINRELVLTIGLPLISNMKMNQLAGVFAHELGHFSQGGAMRLRLLISTVQNWFAKIVVERDAFDETIIAGCDSTNYIFRVGCWTMRLIIGSVRFVLRILMIFSNMLSSFLSREMEYDADSYEARLVGAETFEQSLLKMTKLSFTFQKEMAEIILKAKRTTDHGYQYPTNLTRLICQKSDNLSPDMNALISDTVYSSHTGWFDPHPSDADRLEAVCQMEEPGLYHCKYPAKILLPKIDQLSEQLTERTFHQISAWLH